VDPGLISFTLFYCFTITRFVYYTCILLSFYHSIRSILYSHQTGEIDNLIEVGSKVLGCVVCRFHIVAGEKLHPDKQLIWLPCPECHEDSKHHLLKFGFLLLVRFNLGFIIEGNFLLCSTKPSSWGSQLGALTSHHHVLSCKQQIIALSKVCNVNNTNVLEHKIIVFSLVAIAHLQP
jgi:hypothetical protein